MSKSRVILLLCALLFSLLWWMIRPQRGDAAKLQALLNAAAASSREEVGGLTCYCQQFREGVTKELIYRDGTERRLRIVSRDSELFLFKQENQMEMVEELDHVRCLVQEELSYTKEGKPIQIVHTLEADRATYDYGTQTLTASQALVRKYRLPGHQLGDYPTTGALMTGEAKQVTLAIGQDDYDLNAKGLRLILEKR